MRTLLSTLAIILLCTANSIGQTFVPAAGSTITSGNLGSVYAGQTFTVSVPNSVTLSGQQLIDNISGPIEPFISSVIDPNEDYLVEIDSVFFSFTGLPSGVVSNCGDCDVNGGATGNIGLVGTPTLDGAFIVDISSAIYGIAVSNSGQDTLPLGGTYSPQGFPVPLPIDPLPNILDSDGYTMDITNTNNLPSFSVATSPSSGCNGSAEVVIFSGNGPFTFTFSTGQSGSLPYLGSLCPGSYHVSVEDGNGQVLDQTFVIVDQANVYTTVFGLPGDTLFTSPLLLCDLDFNAPIDSFEVTNAFISGTDTIIAEWVVWQQGNAFTLLGQYPNVSSTNTILSVTLFCLDGRAALGSFQLFTTAPEITIGINDRRGEMALSVYPNPTSITITLQAQTPLLNAWLTNLTGRRLMPLQANGAQWQADLSALPTGIYLVEAFTEDGARGIQKLVKR